MMKAVSPHAAGRDEFTQPAPAQQAAVDIDHKDDRRPLRMDHVSVKHPHAATSPRCRIGQPCSLSVRHDREQQRHHYDDPSHEHRPILAPPGTWVNGWSFQP